ncbi:hypothetical protein L6452_37928 [Arctium lappa]|uniref:Uncharacterized protein n=1 Tax=Arctium lappa TaxID=4217 RepID=A0ACB8Y5U3_ARCLA|nr:hypothetical protein L6452_37928 [Arctium lappa]
MDPEDTCFMHLPEEHLYTIFEKLDTNLDRESFGLTCHRFLDIQNSSCKCLDLRRSAWSNRPFNNIDSTMLNKLLNRFKQLQSLSLTGFYKGTDSGLTPLENYGSKLHSLYLDDCFDLTEAGLSSVASGCPSLSIISLSCCSINDGALEILTSSCRSLTEVNLSKCFNITDRGIWALSQNCRQLRAVKVSWCDRIVGVSFQGCSPTLTCLEANHCAFDPMGVTGILSGGGLEYLSLSSLRKCSRRHGLAAIGLGIAANLKILNLRKCSFVTDDAIIRISKGCPLLQEWILSYCSKIGVYGWGSIGLHCRNLERLDVSGCKNLCNAGFLALGNGCERLSVIYKSRCPKITPWGIFFFKIMKETVVIKEEEAMHVTPIWAFTT